MVMANRAGDTLRRAIRTDVGAVRQRNEDAAYVDEAGRYFVLADGMGGCSAGDVASNTAVDVVRTILDDRAHELAAFAESPSEYGRRRICALVDRAVRDAHDVVLERSRVDPRLEGMGTTLEVAVMAAHELFVAHVGDSRTYLLHDGALRHLTEDHTVAEAMRKSGAMSADEASWSPLRSVLTNAIGASPRVAIDHLHFELSTGDRILLCSDGLYEYFSDDELALASLEGAPEDGLDELIAFARSRGGHDNITGILIEVPPWRPPHALSGLTDDVLASFVERALGERELRARIQLDAEV